MTLEQLLAALALPTGCVVDQRVPKKLLLENGAPTSGDKRLINEAVEGIHWVAALKPNTVGIVAYRDETREYLEIAVLCVQVRHPEAGSRKVGRLAELIHRAVPYPVLLVMQTGADLALSLAHKRWSHNEVGKVVLDEAAVSAILPNGRGVQGVEKAFLAELALSRQPQASLFGLYQGWMDTVVALLAARLTGSFHHGEGLDRALARRQALQECQMLELQAAKLRAKAVSEKQLARQVKLNVLLKQVERRLSVAKLGL